MQPNEPETIIVYIRNSRGKPVRHRGKIVADNGKTLTIKIGNDEVVVSRRSLNKEKK